MWIRLSWCPIAGRSQEILRYNGRRFGGGLRTGGLGSILEQTPESSATPSPGSTRKVLKYGDWAQMTGEQRQQMQQQQQQPSQASIAFVASQVQSWENGQTPRPVDYDQEAVEEPKAEFDEEMLAEDAKVRTTLGKRHPANQQTDERGPDLLQTNDLWQKSSNSSRHR